MALKLNNPIRKAIVDTIIASLGTSGELKVYSGVPPANAGDAATSLLLVTISGLAWNASSNGTSGLSGTHSGTAGTSGTVYWARLSDSSGTAYVMDGSCGTYALCDFVIDHTATTSGAVVTLTDLTIVQPAY